MRCAPAGPARSAGTRLLFLSVVPNRACGARAGGAECDRYGAVQTLSTQVWPPGHWMHAAVHLVASVSGAQTLPHRWKPGLHAGTHEVPLHDTVPFAGGVQVAH